MLRRYGSLIFYHTIGSFPYGDNGYTTPSDCGNGHGVLITDIDTNLNRVYFHNPIDIDRDSVLQNASTPIASIIRSTIR